MRSADGVSEINVSLQWSFMCSSPLQHSLTVNSFYVELSVAWKTAKVEFNMFWLLKAHHQAQSRIKLHTKFSFFLLGVA